MNKLLESWIVLKDYIKNFFILIFLSLQTITRICLCVFAVSRNQIFVSEIPNILLHGIVADVITSFFILPFIILLQQCNIRYISAIFRTIFALLFAAILIFSSVSQVFFWDEFGTNFNFIAVDYLVYTHEIIGTLQDSIPLYELIIFILITSILLAIWIYFKSKNSNKPYVKGALVGFVLAITIGQLYNSETFGKWNNRFAHELSKNGPYEFVYAYYNNSLNYNKFYKSISSYDALQMIRGRLNASNAVFINDNSIDRNLSYAKSNKQNIILIVVESLSAEYMGHFGNKQNITPNLDKIADEGILFTKIYATGTRTARGLEALTAGIPPIPGNSIIRRPNNSNLFTIGTPLRENGYETDFLYGGYSYFDNMKNYFENNDFKVIDRSNIAKEKIVFSNVWGVADENLFEKALEVSDDHHNKSERFFELIMTTSNHRPYNFPDGRIDLKQGTRDAAVKYTDYAIGKFIESAKTKPWFKDTIFIITADHCASSAGKVQLPVDKYHIPLIIYQPGKINHSENNNLASQIDIPPTILSMIGINYRSKFMGQDILLSSPDRAFVSTYQLLGYIKDSKLLVIGPNAEPVMYSIEKDHQSLMQPDAVITQEAVSYYQTAFELFMSGKLRD